MKHQSFFTKIKKILTYPFDWHFIDRQQNATKLLDTMYTAYFYELQQIKYDTEKALICQEIAALRKELNKCWNLNDITLLLGRKINRIIWGNNINMEIFDHKTKWFLWNNILTRVENLAKENTRADAKRRLNLLREISSIFDLGS